MNLDYFEYTYLHTGLITYLVNCLKTSQVVLLKLTTSLNVFLLHQLYLHYFLAASSLDLF
jgi:hypothetical protein